MQTNVRINGCHHRSFFTGGLMELDRTPGERLDFLLRRRGIVSNEWTIYALTCRHG